MKLGPFGDRDAQLDEEIRSHLAMAIRDRVERGESRREAEDAVRREFGNVGLVKEITRDMWGLTAVDCLLRDLQHGFRLIARSPGFSIAVVLTLALGIGANAAVLGAARIILLQGLPYPDESRLVFVSRAYPGFPQGGGNFSYPAYRDMLRQNTSFDTLAAYQDFGAQAYTDGDEPERVRVNYVTPSYLALLGARAAVGRTFGPDEDRYGSADPVAMISAGFRQRHFAGSPDAAVVGRTIHLNQRPLKLIGVMSSAFRDTPAQREDTEPIDVWVPLGLSYELSRLSNAADRVGAIDWGIGHLKPGVDLAQANGDLSAIADRLARDYPVTDRGYGLVARPLRDYLVGDYYRPIWILLAGSALILLIGCANVGNLFLSRLLARRREFAVRAALGASAGRLAQQVLIEQLALMVLAAVAGLLTAMWGGSVLHGWLRSGLPFATSANVDRSMLVASAAISVLTAVMVGTAAVTGRSRVDVRDALSQGGRQGLGPARRAAAKSLVVAEVTLATTLLVSAGLLLKSFYRLTSADLGFDTHHLLTLRIDLRSARYATSGARAQFGRALVDKLGRLPGIESVTLWGPSMLGRATWVTDVVPEGRSADDRRNVLTVSRHSVNPGGLSNLGIRLLRGRDFSSYDDEKAPPVAIVSESLWRQLWPDEDPVGKRFQRSGDSTTVAIVGVAADARHRERFSLGDASVGIAPAALGPQQDVYLPYAQRPNTALVVALRTWSDAGATAKSVGGAVRTLDATLPVFDVALLDDRLIDQERTSRMLAALTGGYALLALCLAAFGLFAVLAHAVRRRTQEIGIRMALGGVPRDILSMVLVEGLSLTLVGLVGGAVGAALLARAFSVVLFGVSPNDPMTYVAISLLLMTTAAAACAIPARRATRVDPTVALRSD